MSELAAIVLTCKAKRKDLVLDSELLSLSCRQPQSSGYLLAGLCRVNKHNCSYTQPCLQGASSVWGPLPGNQTRFLSSQLLDCASLTLTQQKWYVWNAPLPTPPHFSEPLQKQPSTFHPQTMKPSQTSSGLCSSQPPLTHKMDSLLPL